MKNGYLLLFFCLKKLTHLLFHRHWNEYVCFFGKNEYVCFFFGKNEYVCLVFEENECQKDKTWNLEFMIHCKIITESIFDFVSKKKV